MFLDVTWLEIQNCLLVLQWMKIQKLIENLLLKT